MIISQYFQKIYRPFYIRKQSWMLPSLCYFNFNHKQAPKGTILHKRANLWVWRVMPNGWTWNSFQCVPLTIDIDSTSWNAFVKLFQYIASHSESPKIHKTTYLIESSIHRWEHIFSKITGIAVIHWYSRSLRTLHNCVSLAASWGPLGTGGMIIPLSKSFGSSHLFFHCLPSSQGWKLLYIIQLMSYTNYGYVFSHAWPTDREPGTKERRPVPHTSQK